MLQIATLPLCIAACVFGLTGAVVGQCNQWTSTGSLPGTNGMVRATLVFDPDGAGPATSKLAIAGEFTSAGDVAAQHIATWDPASGAWAALGSGLSGGVYALTALPNGDLVAGGYFTTAGGVAANNIARWDGSTWSPLGAGTNGYVYALATLPNGEVVAGGFFSTAGGVPASYVARWDGSAWSPLGAGTNERLNAVMALPNGDVVAGGKFTLAGGIVANHVARWNGTTWSALGSGVSGGLFQSTNVESLTVLPNGDIVAGGEFTVAGGVPANYVASWNGTTWSPLGSGLDLGVLNLEVLPGGDLVACGWFSHAGGVPTHRVARWNGSFWAPLGSGLLAGAGMALAVLPNGDLVVGGTFPQAGAVPALSLARWNGNAWSAMSGPTPGLGAVVRAAVAFPNGDFLVGGDFSVVANPVSYCIARWIGGAWSPVGAGVNGVVHALTTMPQGDVVAGGTFTLAGGVQLARIGRWDGSVWSPLGSGIGGDGTVDALVALPNGNIVVGGPFTLPGWGVAQWNGSTWSPMGTGGRARALLALPNGDVVAALDGGGSSGGSILIARWDGSTWTAFGRMNGYLGLHAPRVYALALLPNGDLVAGGAFATVTTVPPGGAPGTVVAASGIARWDGSIWSAMGSGVNAEVHALAVLANGDLAVGGAFTTAGGIAASRLARWTSSGWLTLGEANGTVRTLATAGDRLAAGGDFTVVNGVFSAHFAIVDPCLASHAVFGAGCPGSLGVPGNVPVQLPRIGTTMAAEITNMPQNAGMLVIGWSNTTSGLGPLPIDLSALGMPGCHLRVSMDVLGFLPGIANTGSWSLVIPNSPSYFGLAFHTQCLVLDPPAGPFGATMSDAATVTIGQ